MVHPPTQLFGIDRNIMKLETNRGIIMVYAPIQPKWYSAQVVWACSSLIRCIEMDELVNAHPGGKLVQKCLADLPVVF